VPHVAEFEEAVLTQDARTLASVFISWYGIMPRPLGVIWFPVEENGSSGWLISQSIRQAVVFVAYVDTLGVPGDIKRNSAYNSDA
jgi:hypothetical protein